MGLARGKPTNQLRACSLVRGRSGGDSFDPEEDRLAGCLNWRAVRAGQQLATAGAQNHDPDTRPFTWRTCFPCQVLTKGLLTSVSGVRTAQYVAELSSTREK